MSQRRTSRSPSSPDDGLWIASKAIGRTAAKKCVRIGSEIIADMIVALIILVGIWVVDKTLRYLYADDLIFFAHHQWPLDARTLLDIGHAANLALFIVMSVADCIKAYRQ